MDKTQKEALQEHYRLTYQYFNSFGKLRKLDCIDDALYSNEMPISFDFETACKAVADWSDELENYMHKTDAFSSQIEL